MTDHNGLPVHGYQPQSDVKVALVNEFKQDEERLLRKLDRALRANNAELPWQPFVDPRWVAIARSHFEQGFMALNRSVFQPQRVRLPGEDTPETEAQPPMPEVK